VEEEPLDPQLGPGDVEPPPIAPIPPADDPPSDEEEIMADAPAAPAKAVPFALTPAEAISDVLNYSKRKHMRLYESAVAPLEGDKFDGTAENLANFLTRLREKAEIYTWYESVCKVKIGEGVYRNLIEEYGNITQEQVKAHATPYVGQEQRIWQNSHQMKCCLFASLTKEFQNRVNLHKKLWHINDKAEGASLLKVIVYLANPDTQATTAHIRTQLTKTDDKIVELQFNILKFNDWVNKQVAGLEARGETTSDLLVNLFKGYDVVPDAEFKADISDSRRKYDRGEELTAEQLMLQAQNKYKNRVQSKTWNAPSDEQEQIIALQASLALLTKKGNTGNNKGGQQQGNASRQKPKSGNKGNRNPKKSRTGIGNAQERDGDYLNATGKWSWLKVAPKSGEKLTKTHDGKQFFWCKNHSRWGRHAPAD
jgi:hypothetical protein